MTASNEDEKRDTPRAGAALRLQPEEKLYTIKKLCAGFGPPIQARQNHRGDTWHVKTPAMIEPGSEAPAIAIEGIGATPEEAIEDCWSQLVDYQVLLHVEGMAPRRFRWDGIRFCEA